MGSTARQHRYQVPMATRSTDASVIDQCAGRFVLTLLHEDDQKPASFFALGSSLHDTIEAVCLENLSPIEAHSRCRGQLREWIRSIGDKEILETSKRGVDTILDDADRMLTNWFRFCHPDGDKRHPAYDDLEWPPKVETVFQRTGNHKYPVWGSIDAIFDWKYDPDHKVIVDWKSGTQRTKTDFQLWFYTYGIGFDPETTAQWFHNLDRVRKNSIVQVPADVYPGDEAIIDIINTTEEIKEAIVAGDTPDFNPDWYCNFCPVQDFCPADGDPRNRDGNLDKLESVLHLLKPMRQPYQGE